MKALAIISAIWLIAGVLWALSFQFFGSPRAGSFADAVAFYTGYVWIVSGYLLLLVGVTIGVLKFAKSARRRVG